MPKVRVEIDPKTGKKCFVYDFHLTGNKNEDDEMLKELTKRAMEMIKKDKKDS